MIKLNRFVVALLIFIFFSSSVSYSQKQIDETYKKLNQIKLFESDRKHIESIFNHISLKESKSVGFLAVDYELNGSRLTVFYSSGRCVEHGSGLAYDVAKDVVVGVDLFYYDVKKIDRFDIDLRRFRRYHDTEGNSVIFTDEKAGIMFSGGDEVVISVEFFPTDAEEEKYRCKESSKGY